MLYTYLCRVEDSLVDCDLLTSVATSEGLEKVP